MLRHRETYEKKFDLSGIPPFLRDNPTVLSWAGEGRHGMERAADYLVQIITMGQGIKVDDAYENLPKSVRREIERILKDVVSNVDMTEVRARAKGTFGDTMANMDKWLQAEASRLGISGKNMGKKGEQKRGNFGKGRPKRKK